MLQALRKRCTQAGCDTVFYGPGMFCKRHRRRKGYFPDYYPKLKKPLQAEVVMVCGAPASGKSTYVAQHKAEGDVVLDLDVIQSELSGKPLRSYHGDDTLRRAIQERNRMIEAYQYQRGKVWFVVGAPTSHDRQRWKQLLRPVQVIVTICPQDECYRRIEARHSETELEQKRAADRWYARYEQLPDEVVVVYTI